MVARRREAARISAGFKPGKARKRRNKGKRGSRDGKAWIKYSIKNDSSIKNELKPRKNPTSPYPRRSRLSNIELSLEPLSGAEIARAKRKCNLRDIGE